MPGTKCYFRSMQNTSLECALCEIMEINIAMKTFPFLLIRFYAAATVFHMSPLENGLWLNSSGKN